MDIVTGSRMALAEARFARGRRRAQFVPDHQSFGEFIMTDDMRQVTASVARDIANLAKKKAAGHRSGDGDHYGDHYLVETEAGSIRVHRAKRVLVRVVNTDPVAAINEWGHGPTPRRRTLGRAGAHYGDFKPDGGLQ